jgi:hypothetical protein
VARLGDDVAEEGFQSACTMMAAPFYDEYDESARQAKQVLADS